MPGVAPLGAGLWLSDVAKSPGVNFYCVPGTVLLSLLRRHHNSMGEETEA